MIWRLIRVGGNVLALFLTCFIVGTGVGFNLGEITARTWERPAQIAFSEGAAGIGGGVACILGPILYYIILGRRVSFEEFAIIVASAFIGGSLAGLAGSEFITPIIPVLVSAIAATIIKFQRAGSSLPQ